MMIACNRGAGQNMGFPDVCLTPAGPAVVPIPYPNIGMNAQATGFATKIVIRGMNALNLGSQISATNGDQAGSAHWSIMGTGMFTKGDMKTFFEALPGVTLTSMATGNKGNCAMSLAAVPSATNVFLTQRAGGTSVTLMTGEEREQHARVSLRTEVSLSHHDGVAVLTIPSFARNVPAMAFNLLREPPETLVIDLRGNPGGDLDVMLELADDFLPSSTSMLTVRHADGDEEDRLARQRQRFDMPVAILVDGGTASAAEIFAGILQCCGRATVIGSCTYGKGSVQRFNPVPVGDRSELVDVAMCVLPDGSQPPIVPDAEGGLDVAISELARRSRHTSP